MRIVEFGFAGFAGLGEAACDAFLPEGERVRCLGRGGCSCWGGWQVVCRFLGMNLIIVAIMVVVMGEWVGV